MWKARVADQQASKACTLVPRALTANLEQRVDIDESDMALTMLRWHTTSTASTSIIRLEAIPRSKDATVPSLDHTDFPSAFRNVRPVHGEAQMQRMGHAY